MIYDDEMLQALETAYSSAINFWASFCWSFPLLLQFRFSEKDHKNVSFDEGGLILKAIFSLASSSKNVWNHFLQLFNHKLRIVISHILSENTFSEINPSLKVLHSMAKANMKKS